MLLVDTNVLVDVLENDPEWADWSTGQLRAQSKVYRLVINPVICSELSLTFSTVEALDKTVEDLALALVEVPRPALFLAAKPSCAIAARGAPGITCSPTSSSVHTPLCRDSCF